MTGTLTIAFVPGVSPAKWARVWRERMPDVDLVLRAVGPTEVGTALAGDVDMCFARLPVDPALHAIPLWTETPVVAAPKDSVVAEFDALTAEDLAGLSLLGEGPVPHDVDATLDLVEAGAGYAVLPQSLFRAASRKELVGRPLVDAEGTRIALAWRDADTSDLTEEFIGVVRGRTANSSRRRADEPGPAAASTAAQAPARAPAQKKKPQPKQKPIPGGPNSRGAQLANSKGKRGGQPRGTGRRGGR